MEIKGYITNLGKYNEGELIGKYIEFPIDEDELNEALKSIGCRYIDENGESHNDQYEEFFFTDWECDTDFGFGEYEQIERINEIAEIVSGFNSWEEETFKAAFELFSLDEALEVDNFNLIESIQTDYDLGYYWAVESGCYEIDGKNPLMRYIDYEGFGRDIRLESSGGFTSLGWLEVC